MTVLGIKLSVFLRMNLINSHRNTLVLVFCLNLRNRIRGNLISYGHVLFLGCLTGLTGFLVISRSMNVLVFD